MQELKIQQFKEEYPGESFPWFQELDPNAMREIRRGISNKLGLENDSDSLALMKTLDANSSVVEGSSRLTQRLTSG